MSDKSKSILNKLSVSFEYPVVFTNDTFNIKNKTFLNTIDRLNENTKHKAIVFIDECVLSNNKSLSDDIKNYFKTFEDKISLVCNPIVIQGGSVCKNSKDVVTHIFKSIVEYHLDRHSFVIAVGGGSVLDCVGFVSSLIHRGLRFIRIPTTVLSQADAGIGVKNGIDYENQKNCIGTFSPPFAVINDSTFLKSLPKSSIAEGLSEAIKVAIIRNPKLFDYLEKNSQFVFDDFEKLNNVIFESAKIHLNQICFGGDPFEFGSARPLDFGHWIAHRLEIMSEHEISHGMGVAIGIAADSVYAHFSGLLPQNDMQMILKLLKSLNLPIFNDLLMSEIDGKLAVVKGLHDFREHLGGILCITLPTSIGKSIEIHDMDDNLIRKSFEYLKCEVLKDE